MSTLMEDRLTAALEARAECVQAVDLRALELPERRRFRRPAITGLVAAATLAVVVPAALQQDLPPAPEPTLMGAAAQVGEPMRVNLDGEGFAESVRLLYDPETWDYRVVAGRPSERFVPDGRGISESTPRLIDAADVDGDGREEVAIDVGEYFPVFFTYVAGDGIGFDSLRKLRAADITEKINGWSTAGRLNDWFLRDGRLVTWHADDRDDGGRVAYWEWEVVDDRLVPGPPREGCLTGPDSLPAPCPGGAA